MNVISRSQAKEKGLTRYYTGKPCLRGHETERATRNGECLGCALLRLNDWRKSNPEKRAEHRRKHKELHRDIENQQHKQWLNADPERKEKYRLQKNEATIAWQKNNPEKRLKNVQKYRASKIERMPAWLLPIDNFEMECIYKYCSVLNSIGLKYHVDHIIPMKGESVSGMHVPWNLQVIPAIDNIRKNNRLEVV